jgi:hypothetical protein
MENKIIMNGNDGSVTEKEKKTVSAKEKKLYRDFTDSLVLCIACFTPKKQLIDNADEFVKGLDVCIANNRLEDVVQNNLDLVHAVAKNGFKYTQKTIVPVALVKSFRSWFVSLEPSVKRIIFKNMMNKLAVVPTKKI